MNCDYSLKTKQENVKPKEPFNPSLERMRGTGKVIWIVGECMHVSTGAMT